MNKKDQELLMELVPIIIKYDLSTIDNCIDYIKENREKLSVCLDFVSGNRSEMRKGKGKSATDEFLLTIDKEKALVIKRICKYLSGRNITVEQIHSIFEKYIESNQTSAEKVISTDKEGISLEIAKFLASLNLKDIMEFERNVQMNKTTESQNTLENWSKLIVKE